MKSIAFSRYLLGFLVCFSLIAFVSCKKKNRDGEIQTAINTRAQSDPVLAGVSATVVNGEVTLTGSCANEDCRTSAEKAVKDIDGVKKVTNNIQVAEVQVNDDATLRSSVETMVAKYEGLQADVSGGVITLRGTIADREKLQDLMMELNSLRPKRIDNQLVIKNK